MTIETASAIHPYFDAELSFPDESRSGINIINNAPRTGVSSVHDIKPILTTPILFGFFSTIPLKTNKAPIQPPVRLQISYKIRKPECCLSEDLKTSQLFFSNRMRIHLQFHR